MNVPSFDISAMLVAADLELVAGTNLFIGRQPTEIDKCVTIYDTVGMSPATSLPNDGVYEYTAIQIKIRDVKYINAYNLSFAIMNALHAQSQTVWNSCLYSVILISHSPAMLNWDENSRINFFINLNLQRRQNNG